MVLRPRLRSLVFTNKKPSPKGGGFLYALTKADPYGSLAVMEMTREKINELLAYEEEPILLMDGFDAAFIGVTQRINELKLAVYSWTKMVDLLVFRDEMTYEEAVEYIDYNCLGAWVGERTPLIVMPIEDWA